MTVKIVSDLLRKHWDGKLPVDPVYIAKSMGMHISPDFGLDGGVSGMIEIKDGRPVISYDITEAPVRQRFTVAHEIGHFALGHLTDGTTYFRDPSENFYTNQGKPLERAANSFAANLLMPAHLVRYAVQEKGITEVDRLANLFNVSQVAMRYRLSNLGLV